MLKLKQVELLYLRVAKHLGMRVHLSSGTMRMVNIKYWLKVLHLRYLVSWNFVVVKLRDCKKIDSIIYTAPPAVDPYDTDSLELCLLKLIQNMLGNSPEKIPMSPVDDYTCLDEKEAKRIAYVIKTMFGVEFAWEVVLSDSRVDRLAKRVS